MVSMASSVTSENVPDPVLAKLNFAQVEADYNIASAIIVENTCLNIFTFLRYKPLSLVTMGILTVT
jgi:hypothetical protein